MDQKLIVVAALCGAATFREQTPYVPVTPEEIAAEAIACAKAGASIVHIHVRDEEERNVIDVDRFRRVLELIKKSGVDVVINLTTAADGLTYEERCTHLRILKPEMGSIDIGSLNWAFDHVFMNEPQFLEYITECMRDNQIKPELEVFDAGMINNAKYYMKKGLIVGNPHFQFVLGVPGALDATPENLMFLVNKLPSGATWSALGIGKNAMPIFLTALALGAPAIRVGLEDGIYYSQGILAKSNAELVERAIRIARECGREIATPDEAREILELKNRPLR